MDIMELSRKMEGDLLESNSSLKRSSSNLSPRVTRSKLNNTKNPTTINTTKPIPEPPPKRRHRKVDEVEDVYLNKTAKVVHKNLETIYEHPIWRKGSTMLLGTSKVKRSIYLDREFRITSKQKSKLRKMKIKRLGKRSKPYKMSDDEFKNKMSMIENYINGNDVEIDRGCDVEFSDERKIESSTTDDSNSESKDFLELSD